MMWKITIFMVLFTPASWAFARIDLLAPNGITFGIEDTMGGQLTGPAEFNDWPRLCVRVCSECTSACASAEVYDAGGASSLSDLDGRQRTMASRSLAGLLVQRQIYVPSSGSAEQDGFIRYIDILSNPTGEPITVSVRIGSVDTNSKLSTSLQLQYTYSDDAELEPEDRWMLFDDSNAQAGDSSVAVLSFNAGARFRPTSNTLTFGGESEVGAVSWEYADVTVGSLESLSFMTVIVVESDRSAAVNEVSALLRVSDPGVLFGMDDTARDNVANLDMSSANAAPLADAGGPYSVNEGEELQLDGTSSYDLEGGNLQYGWDANGDGSFDEAQGSEPFITFDDDGVYSVDLLVTDEGGKQDIDGARITVVNVAPSLVDIELPAATEGQWYEFSFSYEDPGADLPIFSLISPPLGASIDADTGLLSWTPNHDQASTSPISIHVVVEDGDGGSDEKTFEVAVSFSGVPDPSSSGSAFWNLVLPAILGDSRDR